MLYYAVLTILTILYILSTLSTGLSHTGKKRQTRRNKIHRHILLILALRTLQKLHRTWLLGGCGVYAGILTLIYHILTLIYHILTLIYHILTLIYHILILIYHILTLIYHILTLIYHILTQCPPSRSGDIENLVQYKIGQQRTCCEHIYPLYTTNTTYISPIHH